MIDYFLNIFFKRSKSSASYKKKGLKKLSILQLIHSNKISFVAIM